MGRLKLEGKCICSAQAILSREPRQPRHVMQAIEIIEGAQLDNRLVADYSMPNVSDKVVKIIHSYIDYVNRVVWRKY